MIVYKDKLIIFKIIIFVKILVDKWTANKNMVTKKVSMTYLISKKNLTPGLTKRRYRQLQLLFKITTWIKVNMEQKLNSHKSLYIGATHSKMTF